jgi:glucosamine--fructose-6-phosphate aminotransferase (isomerizing)
MQALGARIVSLGETDADVKFASGLDEMIRDVLYLPVAQLIAFEHSLSKGLNPDQPHNLSAVVRLSQST